MPLYEYRCQVCGEVFEKMVRWSDADRSPACPKCQSPQTHKKISMVAATSSSNPSSFSSSSNCSSGGAFR